jgi:hypothetical protein
MDKVLAPRLLVIVLCHAVLELTSKLLARFDANISILAVFLS